MQTLKVSGEQYWKKTQHYQICIKTGIVSHPQWYKYFLDPLRRGRIYLPIDSNFYDHEKAMGGYKADDAYLSKSTFFNKYFWGYHIIGRLGCYDNFLRKHLKDR